jgi:hypothetical protein
MNKPEKFNFALQILSTDATESGVVLGQRAITYRDKTNEILVFRDMLDCINIKGKVIISIH